MGLFNFALYFDRVSELLMDSTVSEACDEVVSILNTAIFRGNSIYVCGNGGSAATSDHFVNDLLSIRIKDSERGVKAFSLCSNGATVTCFANDFGYDFIFSKQLEFFLNDSDVVIGLSASGNSSNVINAMLAAQRAGAVGIGIVGFDGGLLKRKAQHIIHVPSDIGEYGPVEDAQSVICHALSISLKGFLEGKKGWIFPHD
jgi:D-sedoheptulose 7-phosphate isomerase